MIRTLPPTLCEDCNGTGHILTHEISDKDYPFGKTKIYHCPVCEGKGVFRKPIFPTDENNAEISKAK